MTTVAPEPRLLLCHKHEISARLHFLLPAAGGVVWPARLPALAVFAEGAGEPSVMMHPAASLQRLRTMVGGDITPLLLPDFRILLEVPGGLLPVWLAYWPERLPCAAPAGARWADLPACIGMPWLDRELLRRAYEALLG